MDHAAAQDWLDRYLAAWKSYDRDEITDLFAEDVASTEDVDRPAA